MRVASTGSSGHATRPGMTLIEVLLGLAIFLLAIVAISALIDMGTDSAMETTLQTDGTRLAQSKLAEVEAGVISPSTGGSGNFDDEPNWAWTVSSTQMSIPNLYAVTVTVSQNFRGKPLTVTLSQLICDPAVQGTGAQVQKPTTTTGGATTGGGTTP